MFAKRKRTTPAPIDVKQLSSLIAEDVTIVGDVCFSGGIRIDGRVQGNVIARPAEGDARRALLVLSEKGSIDGRVNCGDAVINGSVTGDLVVEHFLELQSSARVSGTIHYEHLQMDVGAAVRGQLVKAGPAVDADTNVVEFGADKAAVRAAAAG